MTLWSEEARSAFALASDIANAFVEGIRSRPIGPRWSAERIADWVVRADFEKGTPVEQVVAEVGEVLAEGNLLSAHPRCFGLFNPAPALAGVLADLLASTYNPQLAVTSHAPASVAIERRVISEIAERIWGSEQTGGHFTSGGAEANTTALIMALTAADRNYSSQGARCFGGPPVFYASHESHFAWFKIAHQLGIGRSAVRLVKTDGAGRMSAKELNNVLVSDREAGCRPVAVVATAGTTNAGMIDPLSAIAEIARIEGLWMHVDAAWAGALVADEKLRAPLSGIELADSVTIDAHKFLASPMGAGMFLTKRPEMLAESFHVAASYMPEGDGDDPYVRSIQWSRRNVGLRLFMQLRHLGWAGIASQLARQLELAAEVRGNLAERGWTVLNNSECGVVVFVDGEGAHSREIVEHVQKTQNCWISVAKFEQRDVIRVCVTSHLTTSGDIAALTEELDLARRSRAMA